MTYWAFYVFFSYTALIMYRTPAAESDPGQAPRESYSYTSVRVYIKILFRKPNKIPVL